MEITKYIKKASLKAAKLRIGISGLSGAGKTMSALKIASGLGVKILLIDTENARGNWYGNEFDFDIIDFSEVYETNSPKNYIELLDAVDRLGYDVVIIDSISPEWQGKGGCIELADAVNNSGLAAWGKITPLHEAFLNKLNAMNSHVICTVRQKKKTALERDKKTGKVSVVNTTDGDVQRDGWEYNFSIVLNVSNSYCTVKKDNTNILPKAPFIVDSSIGTIIKEYISTGKVFKDETPKPVTSTAVEYKPNKFDIAQTVTGLVANENPTENKDNNKFNSIDEALEFFYDEPIENDSNNEQIESLNNTLKDLDYFARKMPDSFSEININDKIFKDKDDLLGFIKQALKSNDINFKIESIDVIDKLRKIVRSTFRVDCDFSNILRERLKPLKSDQQINRELILNSHLSINLDGVIDVDLYEDENNTVIAYCKKSNVIVALTKKTKTNSNKTNKDERMDEIIKRLSKLSNEDSIKANIFKLYSEVTATTKGYSELDILDFIETHYRVTTLMLQKCQDKLLVSTANVELNYLNNLLNKVRK